MDVDQIEKSEGRRKCNRLYVSETLRMFRTNVREEWHVIESEVDMVWKK